MSACSGSLGIGSHDVKVSGCNGGAQRRSWQGKNVPVNVLKLQPIGIRVLAILCGALLPVEQTQHLIAFYDYSGIAQLPFSTPS